MKEYKMNVYEAFIQHIVNCKDIKPLDNNSKCCSWECKYMGKEGDCTLFKDEELELAYDEPEFSSNESEYFLRTKSCLKFRPIKKEEIK